MRIVNKKRFIISMSVVFTIVICLCGMISGKVFSYTVPEYHKIIVSEGDTLWQIARRGTGDIHKTIYQIKEANSLSSSYIYPDTIKSMIFNKTIVF